MDGCKNRNLTREFLIKVTRIGGRLEARDKWWRDAFIINIVEIDVAEVWMGHDFLGVSFARP